MEQKFVSKPEFLIPGKKNFFSEFILFFSLVFVEYDSPVPAGYCSKKMLDNNVVDVAADMHWRDSANFVEVDCRDNKSDQVSSFDNDDTESLPFLMGDRLQLKSIRAR